MVMERSCKFFTPDAPTAEQFGLVAGPDWPFDKMMAGPCCTNPAMGAGDMPVACTYANGQQPHCRGYTPESTIIHQAWRMMRENPAHGEGKFVLMTLVEERLGQGVRQLSLHRMETNDPDAQDIMYHNVLERFLSTQHGDNLDAAAQTYLDAYLATGTRWERVEHLESDDDDEHRSYFAHIVALAERDLHQKTRERLMAAAALDPEQPLAVMGEMP